MKVQVHIHVCALKQLNCAHLRIAMSSSTPCIACFSALRLCNAVIP